MDWKSSACVSDVFHLCSSRVTLGEHAVVVVVHHNRLGNRGQPGEGVLFMEHSVPFPNTTTFCLGVGVLTGAL